MSRAFPLNQVEGSNALVKRIAIFKEAVSATVARSVLAYLIFSTDRIEKGINVSV